MPVTAPVAPCSKMVLPVMLNGSMSSLKVAVTFSLKATFVAPARGAVKVTVGRIISGIAPVLNVQTKSVANAKPVVSRNAVLIVAVHTVLAGRTAVGEKVAIRLDAI